MTLLRVRLQAVLGIALLVSGSRAAVAQEAGWVAAAAHDGVAYFLRTSPAEVARYDLAAQSWLPSLPVAGGGTAMTVGVPGLYVAFGRRISRYPLGGGPEQHLQNTSGTVQDLVLAGPLVASLGYTQGLLALDSATGAILGQDTDFYAYYGLTGLSAAPSKGKLFGRTTGLSPSDIVATGVAPSGTFLEEKDSPYHGDYPDATRTFVFPDEARVADDSGIVYTTSALAYAGSLGGRFDDLAFYGDLPIVLRGARLFAYDAAFRETGRHALPAPAARIFVHGGTVFAFGADAFGLTVTAVPTGTIGPLVPGVPVDPNGLAYAIDGFTQGTDGTVYLLSGGNLSIFRWLPAIGRYGRTIPVREVASHLAYSPVTNRLYVAYPSGVITEIRLDVSDAEQPFVNSPQTPCGLATAGEFVFVCDPSGAWVSHFTYAPDGTLVSQVEWNYVSREYVWSRERRKMYFFRDDSSPNDILWEDIDADGHIGAMMESPYHGDFEFRHPIRIGPDASTILTGAGLFFDPVTLEHVASLANNVDDAVWIGDTLYTLRRIEPTPEPFEQHQPGWGVSEVQAWGAANYPLLWRRILPGVPRRLFAYGGTPIAVTSVARVPQWIPLTCGNGVVDAYEVCDGTNLGGKSCASLGLGQGTLACTGGCTLDASGCTSAPRCGDGVIDQASEVCDGADLGLGGSATCQTLGFRSGVLTCQPDCSGYVTDACSPCGNGVVDFGKGEQCDGEDLGGATCELQGFRGGTLGCTADCRFDTDACQRDCVTQPCQDDDLCTADTCMPDTGCSHASIDSCSTLTGVLVTGATATIQRGGLTGDCAGRCGTHVRAAVVLPGDGTYRIPAAQPPSCPGEPVTIPDEFGTVRAGRRGRTVLVPGNARAVLAASARCGGFKAKLRQLTEWVRVADGVIVDGRSVLVTTERRNGVTFNVRRAARLAGAGREVTPPRGFNRLPDCQAGLVLHCRAR